MEPSLQFEEFMISNGIHHVLTARYHPASNGLAERAVQSFKDGMKKFPTSESLEKRVSKFLFLYHLMQDTNINVL